MAKKQYFVILDSETTIDDTIADFGMVICDRQGNIVNQCAILVKDHFDAKELFYTGDSGFWGKQSAAIRRAKYVEMLNTGSRHLASVGAINNWIQKAIGRYNPILTAYNLAFDADKCVKTNIDITGFQNSFCLWQAAVGNICNSKAYKQFALENHQFNNVTEFGNMTYKTNAECVAGYLNGEFVLEPHTAIEDAILFELPILRAILKKKNWKNKIVPYNWREFQVKNHFQPK